MWLRNRGCLQWRNRLVIILWCNYLHVHCICTLYISLQYDLLAVHTYSDGHVDTTTGGFESVKPHIFVQPGISLTQILPSSFCLDHTGVSRSWAVPAWLRGGDGWGHKANSCVWAEFGKATNGSKKVWAVFSCSINVELYWETHPTVRRPGGSSVTQWRDLHIEGAPWNPPGGHCWGDGFPYYPHSASTHTKISQKRLH